MGLSTNMGDEGPAVRSQRLISWSRKCWIYTVSQNKTPTQSFCNNYGKYEPILITLALFHSAVNCGRSYYIISHLTSNMLPHYLAKFWMFNCATLHNGYSIQKCDRSFIYSKYLYWCHVLDHMSVWINLQCVFKVSAIGTHTCFESCTPLVRGFVKLQCCANCVAGTIAIYCTHVMSDDIIGIQKTIKLQ